MRQDAGVHIAASVTPEDQPRIDGIHEIQRKGHAVVIRRDVG